MSESTNDISHISGNAPYETKNLIARPYSFFRMAKGFGNSIAKRLVVTEVSVENKSEEPQKQEGRVVCELSVEEDMLNGGGNIHGGCSAFLIDICSTLSLSAFSMATTRSPVPVIGVSQSLNIVYHSPAVLGDRLRVVNTTMTLGARAMSARSEIWNLTRHRLVASGVHIKMQPSTPKAKL